MSRALNVVASVWVAGAIVAGCGGGDGGAHVDAAKAEALVVKSIKDLGVGTAADITSNKCPTDVPVKKGKHFECLVKYKDGSNNPVELQITDAKGDLKLVELHAPTNE